MNMARKNKEKIFKLTITAVLTALIFVMAFTPLGFLKIGPISITFIMIPVVIGAIIGGPAVGTVLGLMFGLTSFLQCFGMDAFGTTLFGINPFYTFLMCFIPRILMGLLCGLIYKLFSSKKHKNVSAVVTSLCGGLLNTVFFVGFLLLLFYNTDYIRSFGDSVIAVISVLITTNAVIEWIACTVIGGAVSAAVNRAFKKGI